MTPARDSARRAPWLRTAAQSTSRLSHSAVADVLAHISPALSREHLRNAHLLAFILGSKACELATAQGEDPSALPLSWDVPLIAAQTGLRAVELTAALQALSAAGVVRPAAGGTLQLANAMFAPQRGAAAIDWTFILRTLAGSAAALHVARAFGDLLGRPDEFGYVTRADVGAQTLYSEGAIKHAIAAVVRAGVVERDGLTKYRFSSMALGRPAHLASPLAERETASSVAIGASGRSAAATAAREEARAPVTGETLVPFTVDGVALYLARGETYELELESGDTTRRLRVRIPRV